MIQIEFETGEIKRHEILAFNRVSPTRVLILVLGVILFQAFGAASAQTIHHQIHQSGETQAPFALGIHLPYSRDG